MGLRSDPRTVSEVRLAEEIGEEEAAEGEEEIRKKMEKEEMKSWDI